ncbi:protein TBATA isoform X2 [Choloepus didactylus]|uniref:protein TBATA isoform X2 n=1 Tax=Choloepus didactylus TaxID=27675 RepID=UPI00189EF633|nr:protein TBATA isoform X2 [Choloepus didactylus]
MASDVRTQLVEHPLTSPKAELKSEKKPEHRPRRHRDSRPQKELVIPGIVDFQLTQEAVRAPKPRHPGTYRFGRLSHHSFFSRHHPHPQHVTHIQEAWRRELKDLASRVAIFTKEDEMKNKEQEEPQREQGARYSAETGRLIPASTRATAHRNVRQGQRNQPPGRDGGVQASILQDQELLVLELLCQILQTDSLGTIQLWLLSASPKDKDLVLGLLQMAVAQLLPQPLISIPTEQLLGQIQEVQEQAQEAQQPRSSQFLKKTKTPPVPKSEKPEHTGKAQVLWMHSSQNSEEKTLKPKAEN